jgi:hypothetical protein
VSAHSLSPEEGNRLILLSVCAPLKNLGSPSQRIVHSRFSNGPVVVLTEPRQLTDCQQNVDHDAVGVAGFGQQGDNRRGKTSSLDELPSQPLGRQYLETRGTGTLEGGHAGGNEGLKSRLQDCQIVRLARLQDFKDCEIAGGEMHRKMQWTLCHK